MGINNVYKLLKSYCTTYEGYASKHKAEDKTGQVISISRSLRNKTIAIDINNVVMDLLYNVIVSDCMIEDIETIFFNKLNNFLRYMTDADIKMIAVYDGQHHDLKRDVKWRKNTARENINISKYMMYETTIYRFLTFHVPNKYIWNALVYHSFEKPKMNKYISATSIYDPSKVKAYNELNRECRINPKTDICTIDREIMTKILDNVLKKTQLTSTRSSYEYDKQKVKQLLDAYGVIGIVAPYEAESYISGLVTYNLADYGLSNDSDLFAHLCPKILRKINYYDALLMVQDFDLQQVIKGFNMTKEMFVDLLICNGSDYNNSVYGYSYKKTYDMIIKYGNPLNWKELDGTSVNVTCIKYEEVKDLFKPMSRNQFPSKITFRTHNVLAIREIISSLKDLSQIIPYRCSQVMSRGRKLGASSDIDYYIDDETNTCTLVNKFIKP